MPVTSFCESQADKGKCEQQALKQNRNGAHIASGEKHAAVASNSIRRNAGITTINQQEHSELGKHHRQLEHETTSTNNKL